MACWFAQKAFLLITTSTLISGLQLNNADISRKPHGKVLSSSSLTNISTQETGNITEDVILLLYTRSNANTGPYRLYADDVDNLKQSGFNASHPTKILIHGFNSNGNNMLIIYGKNEYLAKGEYNAIGVDWGALCNNIDRTKAAENTVLVGEYVGQLVDFLVTQGGAKLQDIHAIGHSMGAHVAGNTGSSTKTGKIGRITGLDSSYFWFSTRPASDRLDATDAFLVDTIHTCGGYFGFEEPVGDVDFYPNGGKNPQPGCGEVSGEGCSHMAAITYFVNTIKNGKAYPAVECLSLEEAESGTCTGASTGFMGDAIEYGNPGMYYTDTTKQGPLAL